MIFLARPLCLVALLVAGVSPAQDFPLDPATEPVEVPAIPPASEADPTTNPPRSEPENPAPAAEPAAPTTPEPEPVQPPGIDVDPAPLPAPHDREAGEAVQSLAPVPVPASPAQDEGSDAAVPDSGGDVGVGRAALSGPDAASGGQADPAEFVGPPAPDPEANEFGVSPMRLLGDSVQPGTRQRLSWTTGQSFSGSVMETPVIVVHGNHPGPRLCLTAGVHGDELNGVEVVRRLAYKIEPEELAGTVIAVPIVNLLGFSRGSRYLPDRRDLNRYFPGSRYGSSASRIAHSFFEAIIGHCDALVDFHTGSFERANLPQVRGDLTNPAVVQFTRGFGATAVLHSPGAPGMLRHATSARGVPAVTFEIGGPMRLQPEDIEHGEQAIETVMHAMGMSDQRRRWGEPQAVFYESRWVRVDGGGMLFSQVKLGDRVSGGHQLGQVIDPVSNRVSTVRAPENGRVIGMALNQLVLPGFAAYHIGIAASEEQVVTEAEQRAAPNDERFLEYDQLDEQGDEAGPEESSESSPGRPAAPALPEEDPLEEDG